MELLKGMENKPIGRIYRLYKKGVLRDIISTYREDIARGLDIKALWKKHEKELPGYIDKKSFKLLYELLLGSLKAKRKGWDLVIGKQEDVSLATPRWIAMHRANIFREIDGINADIALGIGLQAIELADQGLIGVEIDREKAIIATINLRLNDKQGEIYCNDSLNTEIVEVLKKKSLKIMCDPSRALKGKKGLNDLEPSPWQVLNTYREAELICLELPPLTNIRDIFVFLNDINKEYKKEYVLEYIADDHRVNRINLYLYNKGVSRFNEPLIRIISRDEEFLMPIVKEERIVPRDMSIRDIDDSLYVYRMHKGLDINGLSPIIFDMFNVDKKIINNSRDVWFLSEEKIVFPLVEGPFRIIGKGSMNTIKGIIQEVYHGRATIIPRINLTNYWEEKKRIEEKLGIKERGVKLYLLRDNSNLLLLEPIYQ